MRRCSIICFLIGGLVSGFFLPISRVWEAASPLISILSILTAAIMVRLNRGMPALDWKALVAADRQKVTGAVVTLTREYLAITAILITTLVAIVSLVVIGKDDVKTLSLLNGELFSGLVGSLMGLSISRLAYVLWRDYDIVVLQKLVLDRASERDRIANEFEQAAKKADDIKVSDLRAGFSAEVKKWDSR